MEHFQKRGKIYRLIKFDLMITKKDRDFYPYDKKYLLERYGRCQTEIKASMYFNQKQNPSRAGSRIYAAWCPWPV